MLIRELLAEAQPVMRVDRDGTREWSLNYSRHREDGPAIEWDNGDRWWYLNNEKISFSEWLEKTKSKLKKEDIIRFLLLMVKQGNGKDAAEYIDELIKKGFDYPEFDVIRQSVEADKSKELDENMDHSKDARAVPELKAALLAKKDKIKAVADDKDAVYDVIDGMMTSVAKAHGISGQKMHDLWVDQYGEIPDTWIMHESKLLDKPTPTIADLVKKYKVDKEVVERQLDKGIKVEKEHTDKVELAREIALDHLNEDLHYYEKLAKAEKVDEDYRDAARYAATAHTGQKRSGGKPYISHPVRVANIVKKYKDSKQLNDILSAAFLHDTIEDTDTDEEQLSKMFGALVASLVKELTSDKDEIAKVGKTEYLADKMTNMSSWALVIKLADRLYNVSDIKVAKNPEWRHRYRTETETILDRIERDRVLSGTHKQLINLIRAKLAELDESAQNASLEKVPVSMPVKKHIGENVIKLGPRSEKARAWIEKVYAKFPQTWQNNHVMNMGGTGDDQQFAMFELVPSFSQRDAVEIKWFQAYPMRQGVGSSAMKELQRMAREDGVALTLYPWDKGQVSQSKLTKFYKGAGFKPTAKGAKNMAWSPVSENFADGKGPGKPGDSARHGIPKGATIAQLEKAAKAPGRKGQLARWQLNMRRGKAKK